jgi:hypothetical protein
MNYGELKTFIFTYLDRSADDADDLVVANIDVALTLAEARMNRALPKRLKFSTLTGTIFSRALTLPTDFGGHPQRLDLTTNGSYEPLRACTPLTLPLVTSTTQPGAWCINSGEIQLDSLCDQAHTFSLLHRAKLALDASDDEATNWILTDHPDCYIWGMLAEASALTEGDERAGTWNQRFGAAIAETKIFASRDDGAATLTVDPALLAGAGAGYNINTDA